MKTALRKTRIARRRALRVASAIITLVLVLAFAANVASCGWKIVSTQFRMAHYYSEIENLESERVYLQSEAMTLKGDGRIAYQNQADDCVEKAQKLIDARKELRASSDPVIAWAAEDYFEFSKLFSGIAVLLGLVVALYGVYQLFGKIVKIEERILSFIVRVVMMAGAIVCALGHYCFYNMALIFSNEKKEEHTPKHRRPASAARKNNSNVVPFKKRRIG